MWSSFQRTYPVIVEGLLFAPFCAHELGNILYLLGEGTGIGRGKEAA